jgi:phosphopantothenoylcysteine decarboxylase / phosphopantothenate---cysteine ligase
VVAHARDKVIRKGVDLIVANDVSAPGVGFEHDTNAVTIIGRDGPVAETGLTTKDRVAAAVLDAAVARLTTPPEGGTS